MGDGGITFFSLLPFLPPYLPLIKGGRGNEEISGKGSVRERKATEEGRDKDGRSAVMDGTGRDAGQRDKKCAAPWRGGAGRSGA